LRKNTFVYSLEKSLLFRTSECGYSKATVVIKNLSLPLAWPSDEYFNTKKGKLNKIAFKKLFSERRVFTVQLVLKAPDGQEIFSRPVENVDRSCIDVVFDDLFYM
jgi:hypothetical protein